MTTENGGGSHWVIFFFFLNDSLEKVVTDYEHDEDVCRSQSVRNDKK